MYTIFPTPGSFNDFSERNPEIVDRGERLHHLAVELSMWRATSPDIDMRVATLHVGEARLRDEIKDAIERGETVVRLTEWPQVGDYEVPPMIAYRF